MFGRYCAFDTIPVNFYNFIKSQGKKTPKNKQYEVFIEA